MRKEGKKVRKRYAKVRKSKTPTQIYMYLAFANSVDPDQLASEEANWSGFALFAIKYVNLLQKSWSSNLIGWQLAVGVTS